MSPGPIQLDQATALTLMLGPNGSVGIQASGCASEGTLDDESEPRSGLVGAWLIVETECDNAERYHHERESADWSLHFLQNVTSATC